jgi:tRNA(Ile)-lysidine synthase
MNRHEKIAVCVSGGVDSVYLLHDLVRRGYDNLAIVHINHQLRKESIEEERFVKSLADHYNLPFFVKHVDVLQRCNDFKESIETAARNLRYDFFNQIQKEWTWLALAHHQNDQAETVLLSIVRGANTRGVAGMLEIDYKRKIWRPLLNMSKKQIIDQMNGKTWFEDSSNNDNCYDRNLIRNNVIPVLESMRNGAVKTIARHASVNAELDDFINSLAKKWWKNQRIVVYDNKIKLFHKNSFVNEHKVLKNNIIVCLWDFMYGQRQGFKQVLTDAVCNWLDNNPSGGSKIFFGPKHILEIRKNYIYIDKK